MRGVGGGRYGGHTMQVSPSQRTGPDSLPRAEWEDCSPTADARTDVQASHDGLAAEARRATAELVGAFALTFVAAGADVISRVSGNEVSNDARAIAPGLLVGAFIYAMGDVSGAH